MTMEAEYYKLKAFPSFKHRIDTAAMNRQESEIDEIPRYQKLRTVPSFKHVIESSSEISREGSETDEVLPRYTSLKDVMANSSPRSGAASAAEPGNIAIRNELVKHAASAYVLSATIIMPENRGRDSRICERIKMCCVGFLSCWKIHVGLPLEALVDFFCLVVHRIRGGLGDNLVFSDVRASSN